MDRAEPAAGSWRLRQVLFFAGGSHVCLLQAFYYSKIWMVLAGFPGKLRTCTRMVKITMYGCNGYNCEAYAGGASTPLWDAFRGRNYSRLRSYSNGILKFVTYCISNVEDLPILYPTSNLSCKMMWKSIEKQILSEIILFPSCTISKTEAASPHVHLGWNRLKGCQYSAIPVQS